MKNRRNVCVVVSIVLLLAILLCGCTNLDETDKREIELLIQRVELSCNIGDGVGIVNCIHPDIAKELRAAVGLLGLYYGKSRDEMFDCFFKSMIGGNFLDIKSGLSTLKLKVDEIKPTSGGADVRATASYMMNREKIVKKVLFVCSKCDDKWYINNFSPDD